MKKISTSGQKIATGSDTKSIPVTPAHRGDPNSTYVSHDLKPENNRVIIENQKKQFIRKGQITSKVEVLDDFAKEGFKSRTVASQIDIDSFQETRILSFSQIRQKALDAWKRAEEKRREILERESRIDGD